MKCFTLAALGFVVAASSVMAQGRIDLRITAERQQKIDSIVKEVGKNVSDDKKSSDIYIHPTIREMKQKTSYTVHIQNMGAALNGLVVKYALFARDRSSQQISVALQDKETIDAKSLQAQSVKTKEVEFSGSTEQYTHGFADVKKGTESAGIGVTVYLDNKRVASFYDPPSLERTASKLGTGL